MQMADKIVLRSVAADPPYLVDDKGGDPSSDAKRSWTSCWSHGSRRGPSRGGSCSSRANPEIRCPAIVPPSVDEWLPGQHLARFVVQVVESLDLRSSGRDPIFSVLPLKKGTKTQVFRGAGTTDPVGK